MDCLEWLRAQSSNEPVPISKDIQITRAWFAAVDGRPTFAKAYPKELVGTWAKIEAAISAADLHPAIVPLRRKIDCDDGVLLLYDRVEGENLGSQPVRKRFAALPVEERIQAVLTATEAVAAVHEAGFVVVDWYEGNMIYNFSTRRLWLFDWELCREGASFRLEMAANYGSSRLMAPEEFVRGSVLDGRTVVFNLGRYTLMNLPDLAEPLSIVLARATHPSRMARYESPQQYGQALREGLMNLGLIAAEGFPRPAARPESSGAPPPGGRPLG